jgi:hypothetical protein
VTDALVRGRGRQLHNPRFERRGDELFIYVPNLADLILEQRALAIKGDLFEDVYGMRVRMEEG